ncbi:beta-1,4-glucuronyltransferase 1-like [Drosophila pseudoobscura]|uniref:beta-1,4-glucuronyltransferase 1 n=1 Tax=Drosophila pseudoobscura pseudoobscura TaxID=46245 RepID=Q29KP0_DROPS|nr:beta-1,4-glucuronyltransferase 1 [Drosophila pseudoobscura]XP_015036685.1 beta-1,4-glucuronyltransferase 1 [Drosophila pseudoobscura]XP_015036686.1 beta-1,4-glucuronyltransferase 1 [Drosophila pseudoobscura]XP_033236602.1 beta-1,4-glucuronyltransferase 1 [Drosophila pseudoobscura]XP_033236603.1 beta-1,4-glucuronyltransferase 1 [Drosophila pseudoobscura]
MAKFHRVWSILLLLTVALVLVWRNLQQAQRLAQPQISSRSSSSRSSFSIYNQPNESLYTTERYYEDYPQIEHPPIPPLTPRGQILQQLLKCRSRNLTFARLQHGEYWLLQNLIIGRKSRLMRCTESITYTTNGDYKFFDNLEMVAERWRAPISFAIHAPGYDLNTTLDSIQYVKNCLPGSEYINDYVTFHVYFSNLHMPEYVPYDEAAVLERPYFCELKNGTKAPPPWTLIPREAMYKMSANLTYPINVGRNIARQAATTYFIFACDIELYPSLGFVEQFLDMVAANHSILALDPQKPRRVYPLPVFEIESGAPIPNDKAELLALYRDGRAQPFHMKMCFSCHTVPGQQDWLNRAPSVTDELRVWSVSLREKDFKYWEPFYVSDNQEPMFDERVTWEGQSNKRIQNYAMCLLGYEYHVLHPAYLVHSPGIKKNASSKSSRRTFAREMTRFIKKKVEPEYQVLYGRKNACVT